MKKIVIGTIAVVIIVIGLFIMPSKKPGVHMTPQEAADSVNAG